MAADGETIVVIEDDHHISDLVALYLRRDGFRVLQADDGEQGLAYVDRDRPKLVIVDIGLPGELDGFDVCRRPARRPGDVPVVMLTARDDEVDRVARARARRRRLRHQALLAARARGPGPRHPAPAPGPRPRVEPSVLEVGDVVIDTGRREVRQGGTVVALTTREFDLLAYLAAQHRAWPCRAASCSTACGARAGTATSAPSTSTSASCARSSATTCPSPRCGGSATGWADPDPCAAASPSPSSGWSSAPSSSPWSAASSSCGGPPSRPPRTSSPPRPRPSAGSCPRTPPSPSATTSRTCCAGSGPSTA